MSLASPRLHSFASHAFRKSKKEEAAQPLIFDVRGLKARPLLRIRYGMFDVVTRRLTVT
jgi:hypothetical protein